VTKLERGYIVAYINLAAALCFTVPSLSLLIIMASLHKLHNMPINIGRRIYVGLGEQRRQHNWRSQRGMATMRYGRPTTVQPVAEEDTSQALVEGLINKYNFKNRSIG
jgi:hypothetical protein